MCHPDISDPTFVTVRQRIKMIPYLTALLFLTSSALSAIKPTSNNYTHSLELLEDDVYNVFWKYDDITITFEVHAKTLGWVGFGLSPNGGMAGSDITITWVKDGQTFFSVSISDY